MKKDFWAYVPDNLVPLGPCEDFEEADSKAPKYTIWIYDRQALLDLRKEIDQALQEHPQDSLAPGLTRCYHCGSPMNEAKRYLCGCPKCITSLEEPCSGPR